MANPVPRPATFISHSFLRSSDSPVRIFISTSGSSGFPHSIDVISLFCHNGKSDRTNRGWWKSIATRAIAARLSIPGCCRRFPLVRWWIDNIRGRRKYVRGLLLSVVTGKIGALEAANETLFRFQWLVFFSLGNPILYIGSRDVSAIASQLIELPILVDRAFYVE